MLSKESGRQHRGTFCRGVVGRGPASTPAALVGENGRGICTIIVVRPIAQQKGQWVDTRYDEFWAKYQELKANAERLHIDTSLPIPTDEQLMFEDAGGNNKGHAYGSSRTPSVPLISATAAHDACIKSEKRL
ncbi:hypothetical protein M9H77_27097 [Catharanthus roseus]|uniref:Uncharacterized protein n=1 Tax=Catharanthus roseus TaxID=4058 RepID=A0ACC0ADP4_CATRO|nr:hypothetical protein M9H77_27097 [Catharanthus roseus]